MPAPLPYWSGKDSKLKFFFEDKTLLIDVMSWSVKPNVVEAADGVCGELRDRLQTIINFYEVQIEGKQEKMAAIGEFLKEQQRLDDRVIAAEKAVGILIFPLDGTQAAYQCREYTLGAWELSAKARTDRNMLNVPGRCRWFDELKTL